MSGEHFQNRLKGTIFSLHQDEENDEVDIEEGDDHRAASPLRAGTSI